MAPGSFELAPRTEAQPARVRVVHDNPAHLFGIDTPRQYGWRVRASAPSGPHLLGPDGRVALGSIGVLVDEVLGYAVMAGLGDGAWSISTEIWIDLLGGALPAEGDLTAEATSIQHGSFSTGEVRAQDGSLLASCRQRGRRVDFDASTVEPRTVRPPRPGGESVAELLGLDLAGSRTTLVVAENHVNPRGLLHGGVSLAACEVAATAARVAAGSFLATTSIHVAHTRPVPLGSVVELVVEPRHAGRTLWLSDVHALVDGKTCATGRVSAEDLPA